MTQIEFLGQLVFVLVPLMAVIAYFARASWNLAASITHLEATIKFIGDGFKEQKEMLEKHEEKINEHEIAIIRLESR